MKIIDTALLSLPIVAYLDITTSTLPWPGPSNQWLANAMFSQSYVITPSQFTNPKTSDLTVMPMYNDIFDAVNTYVSSETNVGIFIHVQPGYNYHLTDWYKIMSLLIHPRMRIFIGSQTSVDEFYVYEELYANYSYSEVTVINSVMMPTFEPIQDFNWGSSIILTGGGIFSTYAVAKMYWTTYPTYVNKMIDYYNLMVNVMPEGPSTVLLSQFV
jgi:hypothetical protein